MSTTKKIAHNTMIQLIGKAISTFLGLLAVAIMTRHLGVEQFGWYVTTTGFLLFIGILCDFGFSVVTASMLSESKHDQKKLFNNLFTWRLITALIFNGSAPVIFLFLPYPHTIKMGVLVLSLSFFFISLNHVFIGYYQHKLKMIIQVTAEVLSRLVLVAGLSLMMIGSYGFLPMMFVITVAASIYTGYMWLRSDRIKLCLDKKISKDIFKKMWPVAIAVVFNAVYLQSDKVILPLYASQVDVGLYGAAFRVVEIVAQVIAMIMGIMLPLLTHAWASKKSEEFKKYFQMSFDLVNLMVLPMIVGILVLSTPIMKLVGGHEFISSGIILRVFTLAMLGIVFGMIFGHIALAIGKQRQSMWIYVTDAIISLTAYIILIPLYGVWGAVIVAVFSQVYAGLGLMMLACYYAKLWPSGKVFLKIIFSSAVMGYLVYILPSPHVLVSIVYGMIIYGTLGLALKIISKQTIKEILSKKTLS
ncbi:MAG: flippase [bacterium]